MKGLLTLLLLAVPISAGAGEAITLQFNERPPFMISERDGSASGIAGIMAREALTRAGIPFDWAETPPARQLLLLQQGVERVCSVGWYKNAEREAFARFSAPLSHDAPLVGLVRSGLALPPNLPLRTMVADPKVTLLVKRAISYGLFADQAIRMAKAQVIEASGEDTQLIEMVRQHRADLTLLPGDQAAYYQSIGLLPAGELTIRQFPDLPPGEARYLMCSKRIDDATMGRIDAAIAELDGAGKAQRSP